MVSERAVDAGLAGAALLAVCAVKRRLGLEGRSEFAVLGAVGSLVLEWILGLRHEEVRELWADPRVKAGSILGFALGTGVGIRVAPDETVSAAGGGLVAYLGLLCAVALGIVSPPGEGS